MTKKPRSQKSYSKEFKASVLKRLESPTNDTVTGLSEELNMSRSTIYQWIRTKNNNSKDSSSIRKWSSKDKFNVVLETATLTQRDLAAYCRRKGLYLEDINTWREQCIKANEANLKDPLKLENDLKEEKLRTKKLSKDLRIKEKALAETAALLVLQKKVQAIWGDQEED